MKIAYFQRVILNDGSSLALLNYLKEVAKTNEVLVLVGKRSSYLKLLDDCGIKYCYIPYRFSNYRVLNNCIKTFLYACLTIIYTELLNLIAIFRCSYKLSRFRPDIIHTNVGPLRIGYYVSKIIGVHHVWHLREFQGATNTTQPFPSLFIYKLLLKRSHVICVSRCISNYFEVSSHSKVIYDGVFDEQAVPIITNVDNKENYFLFVGRVEPSKGVEWLLSAFAEFVKEHPNYLLKFAGSLRSSYEKKFYEIIETLKLANNVCVLGVRSDVYQLMSKSRAVVVSSFVEGFGFVVAEAMFNYTIVVGYDDTATKEQFDNCLNYYGEDVAFRYKTIGGLIDCLNKIVRLGDDDYNRIANLAHDYVINNYTRIKNAREIQDLYNKIICKKND